MAPAPFAIAHRAPADPTRCASVTRAGARVFELDVQLRDGRVVVSHYLPLPGALGRLPVQRDNWRFRVGPGRDRTLRDALAALPQGVDVLLDPKHHAGFVAENLVTALAEEVRTDPGRYVVSTGSASLLAAYRELGVRTWRSIGDRDGLRRALATGGLPEQGVSVRQSLLDAETVRALHDVTGIIAAWTVNRVDRAMHLVGLGVDAVTTDRPRVMSRVAAAAPASGADDV